MSNYYTELQLTIIIANLSELDSEDGMRPAAGVVHQCGRSDPVSEENRGGGGGGG
jgi:hypothetical protein